MTLAARTPTLARMLRRRRRDALRAAAVLLCLAVLPACGPRATASRPTPTPASPPAAGGLLWRVARGDAVSHVLGTVHVGRGVDEVLGAEGRRALAGADTVVVEVDLDARDTTDALRDLVVRRGRLPEGRSLQPLLTTPAWRWLAGTLRDQVPPEALRRLQPWLAAYLVIGRRAAEVLPAGAAGAAAEPMDQIIARRARADGQRLVPLETAAEQVDAIAAMPEQVAVDFLEEAARDPSALDRQLRGLVETTRGENAAADVAQMVAAYAAESPAMADVMFFDRNARWVPRLLPLLARGQAFVAVGAGHLFGERGLLALLATHGYDVHAVPTTATLDDATRTGYDTGGR